MPDSVTAASPGACLERTSFEPCIPLSPPPSSHASLAALPAPLHQLATQWLAQIVGLSRDPSRQAIEIALLALDATLGQLYETGTVVDDVPMLTARAALRHTLRVAIGATASDYETQPQSHIIV